MTISYAVGQRLTATLLQQLADYTVNRPIVRLVQQSAQALADATDVAIQYGAGSTAIDTHTYHSETVNTTRITPLIAGLYRVHAFGFFETETTPVVAGTWIRLNGSSAQAPAGRMGTASTGLQSFSMPTIVDISLNGSTDYVEHIMNQDSAGADNTNASGQFRSVFGIEFLRPS